ncbi:MAG: putative LPS assembly protein LptD [Ignavibacteriaceae bacterium]|jgi:lipopolysaccharide assembly outer membrane protein LptD (OstA)|nr:putative LPS assembly protein LptD [Ignavibacteriaceae bacterium]
MFRKVIVVFVLVLAGSISAQEATDTLLSATVMPGDSLTVMADSVEEKSDIDSVIYASSVDSIIFFINNKKMDIYRSGYLKYKDTELKSGIINVDFGTSSIEAFGRESDTTEGKLDELPVMLDKGDEYKGNMMRYNFKTQRGYITYAKTKEDEAAYSGAKIKKVDKETFFIEKGVYSTCTLDHPHYYFFGQQMKMVQKEQVIGKWIFLAFGDVPFPIPIPFAVFPIQSGRRSGIITPAFGDRAGYGRYFSRFGYFWAINDYMDLSLTADYFLKGGYNLDSRFRYSKRYSYSGTFEGSFSDLHQGERTDPDYNETKNWRLYLVHNQTITPTSRFDANLQFVTGSYFQNTSTNIDELMNKDINSSATYYKNWEESGTSLSVNYRRNQNLEDDVIDEYLPNITFSKSHFYPFKSKGTVSEEKWYEAIGLSYNGQFSNRRLKREGDLTIRGGVRHNVSLSASPKIGFINITPNFSYQELWYNKRITRESRYNPNSNTDSLITNDKNEINFVRTFTTGLSASTKIYGIVQPNTMGIAAFRHILQPTISYSFQPDFSKEGWGYYDYYTNSKGERIMYNKFERELFGGASSYESQSMNLSLQNTFEMKTKADPTDTTSKEKKIQLLNLRASMNYNFAADSLKFSDLNIGYNTQIGEYLSFSGSSTYSLYEYVKGVGEVNRLAHVGGQGWLRLKNFNFAISTSISGEKLKQEEREGEETAEEFEDEYVVSSSSYRGLYETEEADFSIPWSIALNYNYNLSKPTPDMTSKYSNISGNLNFNLTKSWKFSVTGSYDIENKQFSAPQVMVTRDLHCWTMSFTWNPLGMYTGYRFEIKVKAPHLQDLKLTKSDQFFSGR